jgi:hypothetical protein
MTEKINPHIIINEFAIIPDWVVRKLMKKTGFRTAPSRRGKSLIWKYLKGIKK